MGLIVGQDNFGAAVSEKLDFVDKSLFIKEIFDKKEVTVSVIVRPRRFGKTFNLSMLHHFLAAEVNGLKTQTLFDNLKIAQAGDGYMKHQGQYPVVFISFKSIKHSDYASSYNNIAKLMSQTYSGYSELLTSPQLSSHQKEIFCSVLEERATEASLQSSLLDLTHALYLHHGIKPWLLIDEYDTPIQAGYLNNYYKDIVEFMRGLFGSALKGNANMHRAVVTGILRIAKEDLFSGVNNLKVYSVLDSAYADCFGFTEQEVDAVLNKNNLQHLSADIKTWYNGYYIGNCQIYNPWSIANCIHDKGLLKAYWVNTSDNALIRQTMAHADGALKKEFEAILQGQPVSALIDEGITFADLNKSGDKLWSLLLFAGYLTSIKTEWVDTKSRCLLTASNREVMALYRDIIMDWFSESLGQTKYQALLESLTTGNVTQFLSILQKFLLRSSSYFDVGGEEPERFYHGFIMGLIVSLSDTHHVQSNKESGFGRYDVLLVPKDPHRLGLILEFKVADSAKALQASAEEALLQINTRGYEAELKQKGIKQILKIGLAFYGKEVAMASG